MTELPPTMDRKQAEARRGGVRRTVLILVVIVAAVYVGFILSGVLGEVPAP